jgi:hypothetical protein
MEMPGLNVSVNAGFFQGFPLGGLAMRHRRLRRAFGKSPFISAISVDQEKLNGWSAPPVANSRYLQR